MNETEIKLYNGFILINGNTWQPKPLYFARKQQRWRAAQQNRNIIWMGHKPSVQVG